MTKAKMFIPLSILAMVALTSCGIQKQEETVSAPQKTTEAQPVAQETQPVQMANTGASKTESTGATASESVSSGSIQSETGSKNTKKRLITSVPYEKYTLSSDERQEFSKIMGVELLESSELGDFFLNVDWNSKGTSEKSTSIADSGSKISLGLSKLYSDDIGGWGRGFVEYSTYDFSIGSEYATYATRKTFDSLKKGKESHEITVNGIKGVVIYQPEGMSLEPSKIEKVITFPFNDHYIAIV